MQTPSSEWPLQSDVVGAFVKLCEGEKLCGSSAKCKCNDEQQKVDDGRQSFMWREKLYLRGKLPVVDHARSTEAASANQRCQKGRGARASH
jgi:hypothetical protein